MKTFAKILTGVLAVLGFTACSGARMYGQPPSAFVSIGVTVLDKTDDKPVCCARVVVKYLDEAKRPNDTLRAWTDGEVGVFDYPTVSADLTYRLIVEDVAHGVYESDSVDVEVYATDFKGSDGESKQGIAQKYVAIKLEKKTE